MPIIERLAESQINEALAEAVQRATPVAFCCRIDGQWYNCHTRILRCAEGKLWLEQPTCDQGPAPVLAVGVPVGLSFKIKHHKHVFSAVLEAIGDFQLQDGPRVRALRVPRPDRMQRVQRRAYNRVDVPKNRSVLATFWRGGLGDLLDETSARGLVWEGWVTNISAGGFQVRTACQGVPPLEVADVIGVRIDLGQDYEPILAEAQFRHQITDEQGTLRLGFQFVGLNDSADGRETLRRIGRIVCEFQRLQGRRQADNVA